MLGTGDPAEQLDVADEWRDEDGKRRRIRLWEDEPIPDDLGKVRVVYRRNLIAADEDEEADEPRIRKWYVRVWSTEGQGTSAAGEQLLHDHLTDTERVAIAIGKQLLPAGSLREALRLAARWHDLGKNRALWQSNMGNVDYPRKVIAKTGHNKPPRERIGYRHEFGSLLDLLCGDNEFRKEFAAQTAEVHELVLHLIAVHHGRGRPHFPADEVFDPEHATTAAGELAREVPRRYARLQRKYGRWGLAWLESLLRASDAEASSRPKGGKA
jgi:CRISPR-associated endonuclease/helicase Cas3